MWGGGGVCGFRLLRGAHVYAKPTKSFISSQTVKYNKLRESVMINNMLIKIILDVGKKKKRLWPAKNIVQIKMITY